MPLITSNTTSSFNITSPTTTTGSLNINNYDYVSINSPNYYNIVQQFSKSFSIVDTNSFKKIEELVPFKVYRFTFNDNKVIKTVCSDEDTFNLEYAFYLALAKKIFSTTHTFEGVLHKADTLKYQKYYFNIVKQGIKLFNKQRLEEAKKLEEEEHKKEQHRKYVEKKKARKLKKQKERQDDLYTIIRAAIEEAEK